jgi:DNA-directed RNA polymerase subunit RPC12/RpoP
VSRWGHEQSYYVAEDWTLSRATAVKSRTPDQARVFKCPNCGASLDGMRGNTCSYCEQKVDTGEFDWVVDSVALLEREARGPQLGGDTPEEGTGLPTVKQAQVDERMRRLLAEDPQLSCDTLNQRLGLIFQELQVAWSNREWERARQYVSDSLFQTQLYWMEAYKQAGLRNITGNARITCVELARVVSDKYYHALTVRLFATSLDYTVRDSEGRDGKLVSGSRSRERQYSEYWTLIRGRNTKGRPSADKRCPSCGAPLSINMAGNCTHCSARVTSGEFDWVLSRIEQDESYQG